MVVAHILPHRPNHTKMASNNVRVMLVSMCPTDGKADHCSSTGYKLGAIVARRIHQDGLDEYGSMLTYYFVALGDQAALPG